MAGPVPRHFTHWGEASALFSLDIAQPLTRALFGMALNAERLRDVCREVILENRAAVQSGKGIQFLRDLIRNRSVTGFGLLADFVDHRLVTASRPENLQPWQAVLLGNDDSDLEDARNLPADWSETGMRAQILSRLPGADYDLLFQLAIAVDAQLEQRALSQWDDALIRRNREMLPLSDPLQRLHYSVDMYLRAGSFPSKGRGAGLHLNTEVPTLDGAPLAKLDRRRLVQLSRQVQAHKSPALDEVPLSFLALQLREFARCCDASGLDDPDLQNQVLLALFQPSPIALGRRDMAYVAHLISAEDADPEARASEILRFIKEREQ